MSSAYNLVRDNVTRANATGIGGLTATHNRIEGNVAAGGANAVYSTTSPTTTS